MKNYEFYIEYRTVDRIWKFGVESIEKHYPVVRAKNILKAKKKIESVLEPGFIIVDVRESK